MTYHAITQHSVVVRILLSILIGGMIGMERGLKNRPAGLRTYMLVCVGACLIMMTNQYIYQFTGAGDPMRLGAQVVSGIGFLGAGTIVVTRHNQIRGLTTAAGLWTCAGVGLALGIGFYEAAVTAAIGIFVILTLLQRLDNRVHKRVRLLDLYVELHCSASVSAFLRDLRCMNLKPENLQFDSNSRMDGDIRGLLITLKSGKSADQMQLLETIRGMDGVIHLESF
jgi:putative Mg2+ transporter-C (MgtC) family protein